jgi:alpha/beta superfamily hydrolase
MGPRIHAPKAAIHMRHEVAGSAGKLDALLHEPAAGLAVRAAVVFAHPHPQYGGTMHTKVVYQAAKSLSRIGCAVLRFNFRSAGSSAVAFSNGPGEMDDFRAGLDDMHHRYPSAPIWAAGMSFGAWIAMTVGAEDPRVSTLIGISMPVSRYDWEIVRQSRKPKFFIHGERDEICTLADIRGFYARAEEPKELVVIDAADHLFDGKVGDVGDAIEDLLGDWVG